MEIVHGCMQVEMTINREHECMLQKLQSNLNTHQKFFPLDSSPDGYDKLPLSNLYSHYTV